MSRFGDLVLSSALLVGGPACQESPEQDVETKVARFLDASEERANWIREMEELKELDERRSLSRLEELLGRTSEMVYPGDTEANRIRRELLVSKKEAFAAVLGEFERMPSDPYESFARAESAHRLLFEIVRGGFAWQNATEIADFDDREAVTGWRSFWELNREVNEFWQTGDISRVRVPERPAFIWNELVMEPGARIVAKTPVGEMEILADQGFGRSYTWNGATRSPSTIRDSKDGTEASGCTSPASALTGRTTEESPTEFSKRGRGTSHRRKRQERGSMKYKRRCPTSFETTAWSSAG